MKKVYSRRIASTLSLSEAQDLGRKLQRNGVIVVEHICVNGYPSPELAERANKNAVLDTYKGYTALYVGTDYTTFEGYKFVFIGIKNLPANFEAEWPEYAILGE